MTFFLEQHISKLLSSFPRSLIFFLAKFSGRNISASALIYLVFVYQSSLHNIATRIIYPSRPRNNEHYDFCLRIPAGARLPAQARDYE